MDRRTAQLVADRVAPSLEPVLREVAVGTRSWLRRRPGLQFVPALAVTVAMRARFIGTPITSDEGGFLAIARAWSGGARLYDDVWVDRPQGLIVLYRAWHAIGLGSPEGVRLMAVLACALGAVACGIIAEELFGRRAGPVAAVLVAAVASVPQYEGFIANGELLSGSIGAAGLAVAMRASWNRAVPSLWGLVAAGALGGVAISVKQSGFDALTCSFAAVAWRACSRRWPRRHRLAALPALVTGLAVPIGAMLTHGALTGWDRFWNAVIGYRVEKRSALEGANWDRLAATWHIAAPVLAPVCLVVVAAGVFAWRPRRAALLLGLVWIVAASAAFLSGGQFHRHYWVILAFPLGTVAAGALSTVQVRWTRVSVIALLLWSPLRLTLDAIDIPRHDVGRALSGDVRLVKDEKIATWFEGRARPGDAIYALCASAGLYGNLSVVDLPFPYLWFDNITGVAGVRDRLVAMLESPDRPRFIAHFQKTSSCEPSGAAERALAEHYRRATTIDGIAILERRQQ